MNETDLKKILRDLTWQEKVGQLIQLSGDFFSSEDALTVGPKQKLGITQEMVDLAGSVLNVAGASKTREIQEKWLQKSRHKIPLLFMADIVYGYRTVFPIPLGLGATWNPELIEQAYKVTAAESKAAGVHVTFAPMVDLVRDARWGRCLESTGEDATLNAAFARAMVTGLQHVETGKITGIASCVKHFAAYGAAEGGREYNTVDMSERRLREDYLPGYQAAVDAGSELVMTSFNTYDGTPVTGSEFLLKQILREEWGFDGVIISDYAAVQELVAHGIAADEKEATLLAMKATNDIDMKTGCYAKQLEPLVQEGKLDPGLIDEAVWRVLKLKNKLGLFEDPYRGASSERERKVLLTEENRDLAYQVAAQSMVLLENKNNTLPLAKNEQKILLVGPYGDNQNLIGLWAIHGNTSDVITIKEAISQHVSASKFSYSAGCEMPSDYHFLGEFGGSKEQLERMPLAERKQALAEALEQGKQADVIIYAMGEHTMQSGEAGSRTDITLPDVQKEFIQEMLALGKTNILVTISGRPLVLTEEANQMDAILQAWFPGTEGGRVIADILFGEINPSGRLSMSFPYTVGQLPIYYNGFQTGRPLNSETHKGRFVSKYLDSPNAPLYPFGYGLSYSNVELSSLTLDAEEMVDQLHVSVQIKNNSSRGGFETVQLYVQDIVGSVVRPTRELKKFKKVYLKAQENTAIHFTLTREDLFYYTKKMDFTVEPGDFNLFVGLNSRDTLSASFTLK
ncbi:beta-glucosidase BglX [Listeria valentina]|uniref:beta-glucosidase BglX n=1 Tax=Listeria valentina TaxID=2705293 RepID=UPI0014319C98|nr:beta-glucosidase BglX [Listeria valentina]